MISSIVSSSIFNLLFLSHRPEKARLKSWFILLAFSIVYRSSEVISRMCFIFRSDDPEKCFFINFATRITTLFRRFFVVQVIFCFLYLKPRGDASGTNETRTIPLTRPLDDELYQLILGVEVRILVQKGASEIRTIRTHRGRALDSINPV